MAITNKAVQQQKPQQISCTSNEAQIIYHLNHQKIQHPALNATQSVGQITTIYDKVYKIQPNYLK